MVLFVSSKTTVLLLCLKAHLENRNGFPDHLVCLFFFFCREDQMSWVCTTVPTLAWAVFVVSSFRPPLNREGLDGSCMKRFDWYWQPTLKERICKCFEEWNGVPKLNWEQCLWEIYSFWITIKLLGRWVPTHLSMWLEYSIVFLIPPYCIDDISNISKNIAELWMTEKPSYYNKENI